MAEANDINAYYARRASEYESIYAKAERQDDLASLKKRLPELISGLEVLEIACGTGYWTQVIADSANSILATDLSEEVLNIARQKSYGRCQVAFQLADAYTLQGVSGSFSAVLAGFWWSHVPMGRRAEFLSTVRRTLRPGGIIVLLDNRFVPGSNSPMADRTDADGNTYSQRRLADGSTWEVLKNFPTKAELQRDLSGIGEGFEYGFLTYFWWAKCRCRA
jgi:ubiquinone/menaquinone biosynthesis C-methylase UbiE